MKIAVIAGIAVIADIGTARWGYLIFLRLHRAGGD